MDTVQLIDAKIRALESDLAALRQRRNKLFSPICRLPTELIVTVFKCVQVEDYMAKEQGLNPFDNIFPKQPSTYGRNWVHLMAICRRWRVTAQEAPELWQRIEVGTNAAWRELCIQRARGLPSVIFASPNPRHSHEPNISDFTIAQLPRAACAYLNMTNIQAPDIPKTVECFSLRHLRLDARYHSLENSFMGGRFISLTSLDLHVHRLLAWPECPNLRYLKLQCGGSKPDTAGMELLNWLQHTQQLEVMFLILDRGTDFNVPADYVPTIDLLPALQILKLQCSIEIPWNMFRAIIVPGPSTALHVNIEHDYSTLRNEVLLHSSYKNLLEIIAHWWNDRSSTPIRCQVTCSNHRRSSIALTSDDLAPYELIDLDNLKPHCTLHGPYVRNAFSLFSSVGVLILEGDRVGPTASTEGDEEFDPEGIELMDSLNTVILERVKTIVHVNLIGKWLSKRKAVSHRIRLLKVVNTASVKAKAALEILCSRLIKQQVIDTVEWL